jgi:hypothetical protein
MYSDKAMQDRPITKQPGEWRRKLASPGHRQTYCKRRLFAGLLAAVSLAPGALAEARLSVSAPGVSSTRSAWNPRLGTIHKRRWGIEVLGVHLAAAGYMLEFRYRVLDPDKAKPLFQRQTKPVLIDEATGTQFLVPTPAKVGALRNSDSPHAGRVYWMFFGNPGKLLQSGNRVTVVIGEFRAEGLVVN